MDHLKSQIDGKTKAILVNNPSNPCGSVFTKEHQLEILEVANQYKLPIIADEVYYGLVYDDKAEFHSFGNLTSDVPIIVNTPFRPFKILSIGYLCVVKDLLLTRMETWLEHYL